MEKGLAQRVPIVIRIGVTVRCLAGLPSVLLWRRHVLDGSVLSPLWFNPPFPSPGVYFCCYKQWLHQCRCSGHLGDTCQEAPSGGRPPLLGHILSPHEGLCTQSGACIMSSGTKAPQPTCQFKGQPVDALPATPTRCVSTRVGIPVGHRVCSPCFLLSWGVPSFGCVWALHV